MREEWLGFRQTSKLVVEVLAQERPVRARTSAGFVLGWLASLGVILGRRIKL